MIEISDEELKAVTTAIKNRYDIDFTNYETKSLKRGFHRLISKYQLGDLMGLWQKILYDGEFLLKSFDDLTVNLTELFRNPDFWLKMKDDVLPNFSTQFRLNMFHAGCSSGEELDSMAVVLSEAGLINRTKSLAVDLSNTILEKAKNGEYSSAVWKKYGQTFDKYAQGRVKIDDYFDESEGTFSLKKHYRRHIQFKKLNLVTDEIPGKYDIIFCRNVLIYFDETLKMNVLKKFHDALNEGGFMIVGYYDVLPHSAVEYFDLYDPVTRIYTKANR